MAYAIEQGESITAAMPRIVIERIDTAQEQLLDGKEVIEERIHNARKRFKESRAAVRMIRKALGDQFAVENTWFRDAGRDLSSLRDADAVIEAATLLHDYTDGFHDRRVLKKLMRRLRHAQKATKQQSELDAHIANAAQQLPVAKARVTLWPQLADSFDTIGAGFRRTYRDGQRAARKTLEEPSPDLFHEWRKRVKDHWYHIQILRNVWPAFMKPYRDQMEQLSDALGDRHDLDVLRAKAIESGDFGTDFDMKVLNTLIDRKSDELTGTAREVGDRIYAEPADAVVNRIASYWLLWNR